MLTIGDAMALVAICAVIIIAIFRFSDDGNKDSVKEKECLLRSKNICNKLKILKENTDELFKQFNKLNEFLRNPDK